MKILLSGATGFIGQALLEVLLEGNHQIYALVRQIDDRLDSRVTQLTSEILEPLDEKMDVFINLAGESIAGQRWTENRKKALYESRVSLTDNIRKALKHPPKTVISMSAVGYYGIARNDVFYENTPPKPGFSHDLCAAWENSANCFINEDARVVIFRLGVVLGMGGALAKMRLPFLCGAGGPIAGGKQWFSWVHIDDVIKAITDAMADEKYIGTYNLVAPELIEQKSFAQSYAASLKRPAIFPTPKWLLDLIFGEMASLLTEGAKIVPQRLEKQCFEFQFNNIDDALSDIAKQH